MCKKFITMGVLLIMVAAVIFEFGGWYQEPECENEWDFETSISQETSLYAWIKKFYERNEIRHKNNRCDTLNQTFYRNKEQNKPEGGHRTWQKD